MKTTNALRRRGFGLIDVSLGIIAGLGLLIGAVVLFQQVSTNNTVADVTRNAAAVSSEIRAAARNLESFEDLQTTPNPDGPDLIDLVSLGLEPALYTNPKMEVEPNGQSFTMTFLNLPDRACNRAAATPANLGFNVASADCTAGTLTVVYER